MIPTFQITPDIKHLKNTKLHNKKCKKIKSVKISIENENKKQEMSK